MKWRVTHIPVVSFLARRKAYPYLSSLIAVGQLLHLISSSDSQFLPAGSSHISLLLPEFQVYSSVSNIPPKKNYKSICFFSVLAWHSSVVFNSLELEPSPCQDKDPVFVSFPNLSSVLSPPAPQWSPHTSPKLFCSISDPSPSLSTTKHSGPTILPRP